MISDFVVVDRERTITDMTHKSVLLVLLLTSLTFCAVSSQGKLRLSCDCYNECRAFMKSTSHIGFKISQLLLAGCEQLIYRYVNYTGGDIEICHWAKRCTDVGEI